MSKRNQIHVYLDDEIAEWIRREAERRNISVSQVIRDLALIAMLAEKNEVKKK